MVQPKKLRQQDWDPALRKEGRPERSPLSPPLSLTSSSATVSTLFMHTEGRHTAARDFEVRRPKAPVEARERLAAALVTAAQSDDRRGIAQR